MLNLKTTALGIAVLLAACSKRSRPQPQPAYSYRSLNNVEVRYLNPFSLDIDEDDTDDVFFTVALRNDQQGTHAMFTAVALKTAKMLSRPDSVVRLQAGDEIPVLAPYPHEWNGFVNHLCTILLPAANPSDTTWLGDWVAADKKFMGVQFRKGNDTFLGWIAASVDTVRDCMILHDCAWRHVNAGAVKAGKRLE